MWDTLTLIDERFTVSSPLACMLCIWKGVTSLTIPLRVLETVLFVNCEVRLCRRYVYLNLVRITLPVYTMESAQPIHSIFHYLWLYPMLFLGFSLLCNFYLECSDHLWMQLYRNIVEASLFDLWDV